MTVYQNLAFALTLRRLPKAEITARVHEAAQLLGLETLLERKPRHLSGGQRQRVALARAIVREPSLFLLDEPLSNLDAKLRASAREELEQFQKKIGTTTIYVTHDQVEAMAMGDRVVVMNQGAVRQIGTPADVYDEPKDTFVATFLGSPPMNLIETSNVIAGFRPEHLYPAAALPREEPVLRLAFRMKHEEYLGAERILYGVLEGGPFDGKKSVARMSSTLAARFAPDTVHDFAVANKDLKFFDREKGTRTEARALA